MKIRQGFVTNSSSSSFVIALNKGASDNTIKTKEELDKYYIERYGSREDTITDIIEDSRWVRDKYTRELKYIEENKWLYFGSIETGSEEDFETIVNDLGFEIEWDEV